MNRTSTLIAQFKAETLLENSHIIQQINKLKNDLKYRTDGSFIAFDDYYLRLQKMVDELPKLKLDTSLPGPGTENQYIIMLVQAMEDCLDKAEVVEGKVIHFQSKLKDAQGQIKVLLGAFNAWYILAASDSMSSMGVKLPPAALKALADSEFTRLMDGIDIAVSSLLLAVNVQQKEIGNHKKTQKEKFDLGKDQANASWTNSLPSFGSSIGDPRPGFEAHSIPELEEEDTDVPAFVSKKPQTAEELPSFSDDFSPTATRIGPSARLGPGIDRIAEIEKENEGKLEKIVAAVQERLEVQFPIETVEVINETSPGIIKPEGVIVASPTLEEQEVNATAPGTVKAAKKAAEPKVTKTFTTPDSEVVVREKEGFPDKIKCGLCDRRIRVGQTMYKKGGDYFHADQHECTGKEAVVAEREERKLPVPGPVSDDTIHHGPFPPDMLKKVELVPLDDRTKFIVGAGQLSDLLARARSKQQTPEEKEEQRRSFAAANVAMDTGRPVEEVRKDVDKAAETPLPPRRELSFLEEDQEIV